MTGRSGTGGAGPLLATALATCLAASFTAGPAHAEDPLLTDLVEFTGTIAFLGMDVPGMVLGAWHDGETAVSGFGETLRGSGTAPDGDTLMRIASVSKTFCGGVLASLAAEGVIGLADPLQSHLGEGFVVPERDGRTLRIVDLVTHASGLPREVPMEPGPPDDPFGNNTPEAQRAGLGGDPFLFPPGTGAYYSNYGYDLLGAALADASGKPYAELLAERILAPNGMVDTVFTPDEEQAGRMMRGHFFDGSPMPVVPTPQTIECAGGLYSTANDMLRWIGWQLNPAHAGSEMRRLHQAAWLWRDGLNPVAGLDDGGAPMDAMSLSWVILGPEGDRPMILHKSGGLQGQFLFVAMAPAHGLGVFAAINQFSVAGFGAMVQAVNQLIMELAPR